MVSSAHVFSGRGSLRTLGCIVCIGRAVVVDMPHLEHSRFIPLRSMNDCMSFLSPYVDSGLLFCAHR